jgi:hypothetical protein
MPKISTPNSEASSTVPGENRDTFRPLPVWHAPVMSQIEVAQTLFDGDVTNDGDQGPAS